MGRKPSFEVGNTLIKRRWCRVTGHCGNHSSQNTTFMSLWTSKLQELSWLFSFVLAALTQGRQELRLLHPETQMCGSRRLVMRKVIFTDFTEQTFVGNGLFFTLITQASQHLTPESLMHCDQINSTFVSKTYKRTKKSTWFKKKRIAGRMLLLVEISWFLLLSEPFVLAHPSPPVSKLMWWKQTSRVTRYITIKFP